MASSVVLSVKSSKSPTACSVLEQQVQKFLSPSHITSGFRGIMETLNFLSERNKAKKKLAIFVLTEGNMTRGMMEEESDCVG